MELKALSRTGKMQDAWSGRTSATASPQPERRFCRAPGLLPTPRRQTRRLTPHGADAWRPLRERSPRRRPGAPGLTAGGRLSPAHPPPPGRLLPLLLLLPPVGRRSAPRRPVEASATFASSGPSRHAALLGIPWAGRSHGAGRDVAEAQPARTAGATAPGTAAVDDRWTHLPGDPRADREGGQIPDTCAPSILSHSGQRAETTASPSRHRSGAQPRHASLMCSPRVCPVRLGLARPTTLLSSLQDPEFP